MSATIEQQTKGSITMQNAPTKQITLKDVGPIHQLSIPIPQNGGVVVLRGPNGSGKSHALSAIQRLAGGETKIPIRDGSKSAEVDGLGIKIVIAKKQNRLGELEVRSLEGIADIGELVDPGIDDQARSDLRRINNLLRMSGVKPSREMFVELLNGSAQDFSSIITSDDITDDIVDTAGKVKRRFEAQARRCEDEAIKAQATIDANQKDISGVDLTLAWQVASLRSQHEAAIADKAAIMAQKDAADKALVAAAEAQRQLDAGAKFDETSEQISTRGKTLRDKIQEHEAALNVLKAELEAALGLYKVVKAYEESTAQWQASIDAAKSIKAPTDADVTAAIQRTENAKAQYEVALAAERLNQKAEEIKVQQKKLKSAQEQAEMFRNAARGTETVLAKALNLQELRIVDGRLVMDTERGEEFFSELSEGERWNVALSIASRFVGSNGLIVAPQPAWEGLDNEHRRNVAKKAEELGVTIITAEADMDELHSEQFNLV